MLGCSPWSLGLPLRKDNHITKLNLTPLFSTLAWTSNLCRARDLFSLVWNDENLLDVYNSKLTSLFLAFDKHIIHSFNFWVGNSFKWNVLDLKLNDDV